MNTPSERLGRYELLFKIADGGMGTVHLARTRGPGDFVRLFAIKRVHAHFREIPELTQDLLHEAAIAGRIRHPNVVPVIDASDDGSETFVVMEYVEGDSLSGLLRRAKEKSLPLPIAFRIADDLLAGLQAAHELAGDDGKPLAVVHRDVSPQNVLVGLDGVARVTDFGIAKAASRPSLTKTGITKGKVAYMAPEQARGNAIDARADVWSAGVVLWEMLAGERLYAETEDIAIALALVTNEPRRLRAIRPDLPAELEDAVHAALQRDPSDRCLTIADYRDRLRAACASPEIAITLATNAELAAFVNRWAGEVIEKRRAKIGEARRALEAPVAESAGVDSQREKPTATVLTPQTGGDPEARDPHARDPVTSSNVTVPMASVATPAPAPRAPKTLLAGGIALVTAIVVGGIVLTAVQLRARSAAATAPVAAAPSSDPSTAAALPAENVPPSSSVAPASSASSSASSSSATGLAPSAHPAPGASAKKPRLGPKPAGKPLMPDPYKTGIVQ